MEKSGFTESRIVAIPKEGTTEVAVRLPSGEDFLALSFDEVRFCAASSLWLAQCVKALAADLTSALPPQRHASSRHLRRTPDARIAHSFADAGEGRDTSAENRKRRSAARGSE
jgi:hypothetical protein